MEIKEAKEKLKKCYETLGMKFVKENREGVFLNHGNLQCMITKEDIQSFADFEEKRQYFQMTPSDCSMCSINYREHIVTLIEPFQFFPPPLLRKETIIFGRNSEEKTYAEISYASNDFINFFRVDENFIASYMRRYKDGFGLSSIASSHVPVDVRQLMPKLRTIRVYNLSGTDIQDAACKSSKAIENCLFQLSYLKNISFWLAEEWPHKRSKLAKRFRFGQKFEGWTLPLNASFNSDIIRFYQFAMSSSVTESKFLAFYQILEYFFVPVSNEKLYEKLGNQIKDPRFAISSASLDRLVQDVVRHRKETDETEMLRNVLSKFVDERELMQFISAYEKHLGENIYTKRHNVFGTDIEIPLQEGHIIPNIAKHIKEVRNALVHSTDRYERSTRHIPFSKTTKQIELDIPLIKFLAERIIISSATPG